MLRTHQIRRARRIGVLAVALAVALAVSACGSSSPPPAAVANVAVRASTTTDMAPSSETGPATTKATARSGSGASAKRRHVHPPVVRQRTATNTVQPPPATTTTSAARKSTEKRAPTATHKQPARPSSKTKHSKAFPVWKPGPAPKGSKPPTDTTIAATSATPAYNGPDPMHCLELAGLTQVRAGNEEGVWEGNLPNTSASDTREIVFLAGPYASGDEATAYAQSLQGIELASAGARWVASAALTSNLDFQVKAVASCMAG